MRERPSVAWVLAVLVICGAIMASFTLAGLSIRGQLESRASAAQRNCEQSNQTRKAITDVFVLFQQAVNETPGQTPEDRQRSDEFFASVYATLAPRNCD